MNLSLEPTSSNKYLHVINKNALRGKKQNVYQGKLAAILYNEYMELAKKALLDGYTWEFPGEFGKAEVVKIKKGFDSRAHLQKIQGRQSKIKIVPSLMGFNFHVDFTGKLVSDIGVSFRTAHRMKRAIMDKVYNEDYDYILKDGDK